MKNLPEGWPLPHLKIYPKNRWFKLYLEEGHRKDEAYDGSEESGERETGFPNRYSWGRFSHEATASIKVDFQMRQ